jgi:hypothetical protein
VALDLRTPAARKASVLGNLQEGGGDMYIGAGTVIALIPIVLLIRWLT